MANKDKSKSGKGTAAKAAPAVTPQETPVATVEAEPYETDENGAQLGMLASVLIKHVDATSFANQRTGNFTVGDSNENGTDQSFKELLESISMVGQKDPITVRRKPAGMLDNGMPFEVIKGFRRYAAVLLLSQRNGTEDTATVNVIIKDLTDLQALEENIFENTARDNLTGPDLAWAAYNLQERYKAEGLPYSGNKIAQRMGKNQTYIAKLLKIVTSGPVVAKAWQLSKSPLSSDAMKRITEMDLDKQEAEYNRINLQAAGKGNGSSGERPPIDAAIKVAEKQGKFLGTLASQGLITVNLNWEAHLAYLGVNIKDLTVPDIRKAAELGEAAFNAAKAPKTAAKAAETVQAAEKAEETATAEN